MYRCFVCSYVCRSCAWSAPRGQTRRQSWRWSWATAWCCAAHLGPLEEPWSNRWATPAPLCSFQMIWLPSLPRSQSKTLSLTLGITHLCPCLWLCHTLCLWLHYTLVPMPLAESHTRARAFGCITHLCTCLWIFLFLIFFKGIGNPQLPVIERVAESLLSSQGMTSPRIQSKMQPWQSTLYFVSFSSSKWYLLERVNGS